MPATHEPHVIHFPSHFTMNTIDPLISSIVGSEGTPIHEELIFDFSNLFFIRPVGVVILGSSIEYLRKHNVQLSYRGPQVEHSDAVKYLDDAQFFKRYLNQPIDENSMIRTTTLPLSSINTSECHMWLSHTFTPWIIRETGASEESFSHLIVCLKEIFNNIKDHSTEEVGCIFVQHFPHNSSIEIGISDFGVGIPSNVLEELPRLNHPDAIEQACEEGFTTRSQPSNMGAGLHFLKQNVLENYNGSLSIYSQNGLLKWSNNGDRLVPNKTETRAYYPGTVFEIKLDTNMLSFIQVHDEDLQWPI